MPFHRLSLCDILGGGLVMPVPVRPFAGGELFQQPVFDLPGVTMTWVGFAPVSQRAFGRVVVHEANRLGHLAAVDHAGGADEGEIVHVILVAQVFRVAEEIAATHLDLESADPCVPAPVDLQRHAVQTQHRVIRLSDRNLRPIPVTVTPVTGGECAIDVHGSHVTVHRLPLSSFFSFAIDWRMASRSPSSFLLNRMRRMLSPA